MKKLAFLFCYFPITLFGQIQSYTNRNDKGYILLTPDGINSAFSGKRIDTSNVALGPNTLMNSQLPQGKENTAIGANVLLKNTTGYGNTGLGFNALKESINGNVNTAIGNYSMANTTFGYENVAIGQGSLLLNVNGYRNVSVGTGSLLVNKGNNNTAVGHISNWMNTQGNNNTSIGYNTHKTNTLGNNNTAVGFEADVSSNNLENTISLGYQAIVNSSNKTVIGNASMTSIGGYASWTNYSDNRLKENIKYSSELGLGFILNLKTALYTYKNDNQKRLRNGLIAQDVKNYLDKNNLYFSGLVVDSDNSKTLNLSYSEFVLPLINAVQEQQKIIENLILRIESLEKTVNK